MNRSLLSSLWNSFRQTIPLRQKTPLRETKCPVQIIQTLSQAFTVSAQSDPQPTTGHTPRPPKHDQADVSIQRQGNIHWRNAVYEPISSVDITPGLSSNARPYPSSPPPSSGHPFYSGLSERVEANLHKPASQAAHPYELTTSPSSPLPSPKPETQDFDTNTIHGPKTGHSAGLSDSSQPRGDSSEPKPGVFNAAPIFDSGRTEMPHDSQPKRSRATVAASLGLNEEELDDLSNPIFDDILDIFEGEQDVIISAVHEKKDDLIPDDHA